MEQCRRCDKPGTEYILSAWWCADHFPKEGRIGLEAMFEIASKDARRWYSALEEIAKLEECYNCEVCAPCGLGVSRARKIAKEALPKGQPVPRYKIGGYYEPED